MKLPKDFQEFIELAISANLKFLVIGGWAYNRYAEPRMTGDIDFFVENSDDTEITLRKILEQFGFGEVIPDGPLFDKSIIMLGRSPYRIDLLVEIDGITFAQAWSNRQYETIGDLEVPFISLEDLMRNKSATGRPKDEADLYVLRRLGH